MVHHQALPVGQEHDAAIFRLRSTTRLEGSHPQNLVIPHLLPLLISLHEEAVFYYIRILPTDKQGESQAPRALLNQICLPIILQTNTIQFSINGAIAR